MLIRRAVEADRDAIAALHLASWRDAYRGQLPDDYLDGALAEDLSEKWGTRPLDGTAITLVADEGGIRGFVHCLTDRAVPYIDNLHTAPARRSAGIGRALMLALFDRLRSSGRATAELTVLRDNPRARRFYARIGGIEGQARPTDLMGHEVIEVPVRFRLSVA
ncbi:GNAT family N-acetyltransferase [Jannaschia aquimarina]|uniref:Acetyltransferase (GNAT) family protein n=1 Tax=Jannaschia aquimarina TaxID=935700 RepID=A0A0D1EIJ2_9RHOB|nr:GNAT family N-acetyltransferase [Jannaschia aquimarina]KIT15665.1 Acetyltransferase (GNAT) family protein [Jannaschia aquimarina]SNT39411.1 Ribosomal protein S18 acetylase RimI [Jannaschia aquimarina]